MSTEDDVLKLLGKVNDLVKSVPGAEEIYAQIRDGKITTEDAIPHLFSLLSEAGVVNEVAKEGGKLTQLISPETLKSAGRPVQMETSTGIPQLNPLYEAALAERASLDGDVPELRSGPLPEGATPAVPVLTSCRDPLLVGLMLKKASKEVSTEIVAAIEEHKESNALVKSDAQLPVPTGIPGYEAGKLPALRTVEASPTEAALLPPQEQRECVYLSIATTQGRRSLTPVIEKGIQEELQKRGLSVKVGKGKKLVKSFRWVVQAYGPEDVAEGFNPVVAAIAFLAQEATGCGDNLLLEVERVDGISTRRFGWSLNVYQEEQ